MPEVGWAILVLIVYIVILKLLAPAPIWPTLTAIRRNRELREWGSALVSEFGWIVTAFSVVFVCLVTLVLIYALVQFVHWAWYN